MLLQTRQLDVTTANQRATIANSHDRNRVLERQDDLSPAALRWLSAPLAFKQHLANEALKSAHHQTEPKQLKPLKQTEQPVGAVLDGLVLVSKKVGNQIAALGGSATAADMAALDAAEVDFSAAVLRDLPRQILVTRNYPHQDPSPEAPLGSLAK